MTLIRVIEVTKAKAKPNSFGYKIELQAEEPLKPGEIRRASCYIVIGSGFPRLTEVAEQIAQEEKEEATYYQYEDFFLHPTITQQEQNEFIAAYTKLRVAQLARKV